MEQQAAATSLAEQIRARVRQADQELIAKRADAAAAVGAKLQERTDVADRLLQIDKDLAALVSAATNELMTARELAAFLEVKPSDLPASPTRRASRKRRAAATE